MTRINEEIDGLALELAWSLWGELGVDGGRRRHDRQAIDLEPLIIFTAAIGNLDSRLRANSMDWCIANARFASAFRLRNLAEQSNADIRAAFGRYAATVKVHAKVPWPGLGDPLAIWTSERIGEPDLRRPSLIQLRLRALMGVSARAEILKLMLADPARGQTASALAEAAGYGKGSVAQALDMLTMAGIVDVQPSTNRLVYRLARPAELVDVLQWLPAVFPDWSPIFRIAEALTDFGHTRSTTPLARAADTQRTIRSIDHDLQRLGIADQVPRGGGPASVTEFEHWALAFLADQCSRGEAGTSTFEVSYTFHHLALGSWMATVGQAGHEPLRLEPDEDNEHAQGHAGSNQPNDKTGAPEVASAMFRDVLVRARPKIHDAQPTGPVTQLISAEFAAELLRPMRPGQDATFSGEYIRRWYENRRQRFASTA
jgi:DNA-binding transcriptional ArsR family regulator